MKKNILYTDREFTKPESIEIPELNEILDKPKPESKKTKKNNTLIWAVVAVVIVLIIIACIYYINLKNKKENESI